MIKHTPWRFREDTCELVDSRGLRVITPLDPSEMVNEDHLVVDIEPEEGRVMAAAPDLLAACRAMIDQHYGHLPLSRLWLCVYCRSSGNSPQDILHLPSCPVLLAKAAIERAGQIP